MRRGGRLILLLGLLIAAFVALGVVFFLNQGNTVDNNPVLQPTDVPTRSVVVARIDIPINTLLTDTETFLTFDEISETEYAASPDSFFLSPSELANKQTIRSIGATERIRLEDVTDAGLSVQIPAAQEGQPRPKAIPFLVNNLTGVADEITPGDYVDVLASFEIQRVYIRPSFTPEGQIGFTEEQFIGTSTKTLLQNIQVLKIVRPAAAPSGTPTPEASAGSAPATDENGQPISEDQAAVTNPDNTIQPGQWLLLLAVTDQQAEVMKFSREQGTGITLVLRGRGDNTVEQTLGASIDLLVSQFGLPVPNPQQPAVQSNIALTPQPTTAPAVQPVATPAPTTTP